MHHLLCIISALLHIAMSYYILRIGLYLYMKQDSYGPLPTPVSIYYIPGPPCMSHPLPPVLPNLPLLTRHFCYPPNLRRFSMPLSAPIGHHFVSPMVSFTIACWLRASDGPLSLFNGSRSVSCCD